MHSGFACVRNMKNSFDTLKKLYIEPSSACNLKCKMCFRNNWFDEKIGLMTAEIWNNVSDSITRLDKTELKTVMFAGMGEPLTVEDVMEVLKSHPDYKRYYNQEYFVKELIYKAGLSIARYIQNKPYAMAFLSIWCDTYLPTKTK